MKKLLDIKSFIIGILVSIIFVLTLGAVGKKESYFDQITTKKLVITNDNRDLVAYFASEPGGGSLKLFNNKMEERISLRVLDDCSKIKMNSKEGKADISLWCSPYFSVLDLGGKSGETRASLHTAYNVGSLFLYNKKDQLTVDIIGGYTGASDKGTAVEIPHEGGGIIQIRNRHFKKVVRIQADQNDDGIIALFDRYGDYGWGKTGKK